jgi:hypothetical protein
LLISLLHPELVLKAIPAISGSSTLSQFKYLSGVRSLDVARSLLGFLIDNRIGTASKDNVIIFSETDRMKTALLALRLGCDIVQIGRVLNWKDFEVFASNVMKELGYRIETNITFTKPRFQIDVIGIFSNSALVIDCKHWKDSNYSMISRAALNQIRRTKLLTEKRVDISCALPVVLTLHNCTNSVVEGIPVVSISNLLSFLSYLEDHIASYEVISVEENKD